MKSPIVISSCFIFAGTLVAISGCNHLNCINGSGKQVSQNRTTEPFSKIETSGSMKIVLKQDSTQMVRIIADDNLQKEIKTSVRGNTLKIDMEGNICNTRPVIVYLNAKNFEGVDASGAVEIINEGRLNVKDFSLDLSGSSKVNLNLSAANVKTESSGSSEIFLKGQAGSHNIDLSGSGSIEALDFIVGKCKIESSGASKLRVNVLNSLDINSSGSGEVEYRGNPAHVSNDNSYQKD